MSAVLLMPISNRSNERRTCPQSPSGASSQKPVKAFKFKLYQSKRNRYLIDRIRIAANIWNHCIALHKRYWRLYGKSLSANKLKKHITKLKRRSKHQHWNQLGSQAVQDVAERIDKAYKLFFSNLKQRAANKTKRLASSPTITTVGRLAVSPPNFKKSRKYKSFTLKQAGYKFLGGNRVRIGEKTFKFSKSRNTCGNPKTVTIKRDCVGDLWLIVTTDWTDESPEGKLAADLPTVPASLSTVVHRGRACPSSSLPNDGALANLSTVLHRGRVRLLAGLPINPRCGNSIGFDFGLKTFLTGSDGSQFESPLFFKQGIRKIKRANRNLSRKKKGSRNQRKATLHLARVHRKVANQRNDYHWKLANEITDKYDVICFEDLNLTGMLRLWGRKITDLGFYSFLQKVQYLAEKKGKIVRFIDKWFPSSKMCHKCGCLNESLNLRGRQWTCDSCETAHDRDLNAAINIHAVGTSTAGVDTVRPIPRVG
jgi:putative transposase